MLKFNNILLLGFNIQTGTYTVIDDSDSDKRVIQFFQSSPDNVVLEYKLDRVYNSVKHYEEKKDEKIG